MCLIVLLMCGLLLRMTSSSQPQVLTAQGVVLGLYTKTLNGRQIASFEGIPYAKPPIGKHRFKEAIPSESWLGIYNATRQQSQCLQLDFYSTDPPVVHGSEDCLYINVYTPKLPKDKSEYKLLDVFVIIHGGGFMGGNAGFHGPSLLLDRDVIMVTLNYRLGPIGFLSTEDSIVPGNNGLKDQVLALKWVRQNIAAFGGNPNSVTIGGQSAGAASCHLHLLSPLSKGLFKSAICIGGAATNPWAMCEYSKEKAQIIASDLGCPTDDSFRMVNCLRNRPAQHIAALAKLFIYWRIYPFANFGPVVEPASTNAFLPDSITNLIKQKAGSDVPVVFSFAADEGGGLALMPDLIRELHDRWDEVISHLLDYNFTAHSGDKKLEIGRKIKEFYRIDDTSDSIMNVVKMGSDRWILAGISKAAKMHATVNTSPVYVYKFNYKGDISMSSFMNLSVPDNKYIEKMVHHGEDTIYTVELNNNKPETERDRQFSEVMLDLFVSFAANGTLRGNWQPVNKHLPKIAFTEIKGIDDFKVIVEDELGEESFWDSLGLNENIESSIGSRNEL